MKRSVKEIVTRIIILLVGLTIAHLGVTLFLLSNLGADPFNVLVQGIFRTVDGMTGWSFLSHGNVHRVICFIIILVLLVVDRTYVKIGTLICMFCGGPIIDFFTYILQDVFAAFADSYPVRIGMLVVGCIILAFGMTIVIKSDAGTGPNDLVALVISEKRKWRFSICRVVTDVCFVVLGFVMGGVFGVGTVICAFLVGPTADILMPKSEKIVKCVIEKIIVKNQTE